MSLLAGKTIALAGLDRNDLGDVASAIEASGGDWQAFGRAPDGARLSAFDVLVCSPAVAAAADPGRIPVLIVGEPQTTAGHDFILPPVRSEELTVRLARLFREPRLRGAGVAGTPLILAADDDSTTTAILRAVLTQNAMTCRTARDGKEAIALAKELIPAAIVLDVNMPFIDGFEVLATLRDEPRTAAIPVLMLTSVQQEADVVKGFRLGADDYVVKPFNPMELLARIKRLVRRT